MTGHIQDAGWKAWRVRAALAEVRGALALGLYGRAKRASARAIALGWRTSAVYRDLAEACAGEGRWDEAVRALAAGWRCARSSDDAFQLLRTSGFLAFHRGDHRAAIESWRQALFLRPEWTNGLYHLAVAHVRAGEFREAAAAFRASAGPRDGGRHALAAACDYLAGFRAMAARNLQLAMYHGVATPEQARAVGALALALGDRSAAARWAAACATDAAFAAVAVELCALTAWLDGDAQAAACLAKKAVAIGARGEAAAYLALEAARYVDARLDARKARASGTMDVMADGPN